MPLRSVDVPLSEEDRILANAIVYVARKFGSTRLYKLNHKGLPEEELKRIFIEVYDQASIDVAGKKYCDLPFRVRVHVSERHALASDYRTREVDTVGPADYSFFERPEFTNPKPVFPLTQTRWFRQKTLRHSWWYLELESA